jgi:hypothetical protein
LPQRWVAALALRKLARFAVAAARAWGGAAAPPVPLFLASAIASTTLRVFENLSI